MNRHDEDGELTSGGERPPLDNLLPPAIGLLVIGLVVYAVAMFGAPGGVADDGLSRCAVIADADLRLRCYDRMAGPHAPAKGALAPIGTPPQDGIQ